MADKSTCSVPGCSWTGQVSAGICSGRQYQRDMGREFTEIIRYASVEDRFWSKVNRGTEDECWEWTGCLTTTGYGQFASRSLPKVGRKAHRHAFRFHYGYLPDTLLDHVCRNRVCVNPHHLREADPVLNGQNVKTRKDNSSGYRGVSWYARDKKWKATVNYRGRLVYLELFDKLEDAAEAAKAKRLEIYTYNESDK